MDEENKKKIDESWKETVKREKEKEPAKESFASEKPDFPLFVTTLALQATISLGNVPNPNTNTKEENLPQARFLIDTLELLSEKTKGNLTKQESELLENVLYELRMQFINKTNPGGNT